MTNFSSTLTVVTNLNDSIVIVNLTPHALTSPSGDVILQKPVGDLIPRVESSSVPISSFHLNSIEFEFAATVFGEPVDVPAPVDGHIFVVSALVAQAMKLRGRGDFVSPRTARDGTGKIVGCDGFIFPS